MKKFIEYIAQGTPYESGQVVGYSEEELQKIERLYDIKLGGDFRHFLMDMGRSDGGLIGDDPIILYRAAMSVRGFILMQSGIQEEIYSTNYREFSRGKPFVFSIESETQYFYLRTASDDPDRVYQYDENNEKVEDTGLSFKEYMKKIVKIWGGKNIVCRGELLIL